MSRLRLLLLLFLPIFSCLDVVNIAFTPERDCKDSSSLTNNTWGGAIMPQVGPEVQFHEAAFISPIHLLTTKHAVMWDNAGKQTMKELNEITVTQWADQSVDRLIERILLPVEYDENNQISFGDLAIVQLKKPITIAEAFSPICPPDSWDVEPELKVNAFFVEEAATEKRLIPYNYSKGAKYITTNDNRTQEFFTAILTDNFDRVIGLTLNGTTAINVRYWEEFICEHTGICMKGHRMQNWQKHSASHYIENGKIFPVSPCSHGAYVNLMKESSQFTRLNGQEARDLRNTCGPPGSDKVFSFIVTISAEDQWCDYGKCTVESANCTGSLISARHVITSADCIQTLNKHALKHGTAVYFSNGKEQIPSKREDDPHVVFSFYAAAKVKTVIIPPIDDTNAQRPITHNIALLELYEPIPADSHTKPVCIAHSSDAPDELTVKYLTDTKERHAVRYRQTRNISDRYTNDTWSVEWNYELRDASWVQSSRYCADCQYLEAEYPSEISYGSPIVSSINGRWNLVAVTTSLNGIPNKAVRPSYFATFICIHTGICEDGETFTEKTLMPYDITATGVPPSVIRRELESRKGSFGRTAFHEVTTRYSTMKTNRRHRLNRLSGDEYATIRKDCGQTMPNAHGEQDHPFSVPVGVITPKLRWYDFERRTMYCSGAFISTRHVVTTRKCAISLLDSQTKSLYVFYDDDRQDYFGLLFPSLRWFEEAEIRLILIPDQDKPDIGGHFEMAVLELESDVVLGHYHQLVCLLDYKNWEQEQSRRGPTFLKTSIDLHYDTYSYHLSDGKVAIRSDGNSGQIVYTRVDSGRGSMPSSIDEGGPFFRKRSDSDRYYLEGLLTNSSDNSFTFLPANLIYRDICRLTGVCPESDDRRVPNDEHVYFMNDIGTEVKGAIICQSPIKY